MEDEVVVELSPCWCRPETRWLRVEPYIDHGDFGCRTRGYYVHCSNCWTRGPNRSTEQSAREGWNESRATTTPSPLTAEPTRYNLKHVENSTGDLTDAYLEEAADGEYVKFSELMAVTTPEELPSDEELDQDWIERNENARAAAAHSTPSSSAEIARRIEQLLCAQYTGMMASYRYKDGFNAGMAIERIAAIIESEVAATPASTESVVDVPGLLPTGVHNALHAAREALERHFTPTGITDHAYIQDALKAVNRELKLESAAATSTSTETRCNSCGGDGYTSLGTCYVCKGTGNDPKRAAVSTETGWRDFISETEADHLRTQYDTGADGNALFIWNLVRRVAGLPALAKSDLENRFKQPLPSPPAEKKP